MELGGAAPDAPQTQRSAILIFENPDKKAKRPSGPGSEMPIWPFRLLLAGPPGVGKRNMLLNVIFHLDPTPTAFHIVHCDPLTPEYSILEDLGAPIYYYDPSDFPTTENIEDPDPIAIGEHSGTDAGDEPIPHTRHQAPFVIIDEVTTEMLDAEGKSRLERLMNFGSTHRNCSVAYSIQAVTNVPAKARRGFNQFCLWPQPDEAATVMAATRCGVPPAVLKELFQLCADRHDCIWVDCDQPPDSPWRFRLNFVGPITANSAVVSSDYD